jgi:hypothetical protein
LTRQLRKELIMAGLGLLIAAKAAKTKRVARHAAKAAKWARISRRNAVKAAVAKKISAGHFIRALRG